MNGAGQGHFPREDALRLATVRARKTGRKHRAIPCKGCVLGADAWLVIPTEKPVGGRA